MAILNPTIACADSLHLYRDIEEAVSGGAKMLHIDIMDGHYVPNICLSFDTAKAIKKAFPDIAMDVHLMVERPFDQLKSLEELRPEMAAFHIGTTEFPLRMIKSLKDMGIQAGVVINPAQSTAVIEEIAESIDYVLLMGVDPGFSGQPFYEKTYRRLDELMEMKKAHNASFKIMVDGGIDFENGPVCAKKGADILVGGAFVCFGQKDGIKESARRFAEMI